jgi:hypothetical protein
MPRREFLVELLEDRYPEYFIYGPLVFTAASQESCEGWAAMGWVPC